MADYNYIRYANQGATRNRELSEDLLKRLGYLEKLGVRAHVVSGGQPGKDEGGARTGSTRHDHGNSMDADFYIGDRKLDWNNPADLPIFSEIVSQGKAAGITGIGGSDDYMGAGRLHMGLGTPSRWGAGGSSKTAPEWLAKAYDGAPSGNVAEKPDVIAEVLAAGNPNPNVLPSPQLQSVAMATETKPTEPKSNNGILLEAFNKITGKDVQMPQPPKEILGIETGKVTSAFSGLGDFGKALTESTDQLNKQTMMAAGRGRQNTPVEFTMLPSALPLKKRKGSLGGLGGYFA